MRLLSSAGSLTDRRALVQIISSPNLHIAPGGIAIGCELLDVGLFDKENAQAYARRTFGHNPRAQQPINITFYFLLYRPGNAATPEGDSACRLQKSPLSTKDWAVCTASLLSWTILLTGSW